MLFYRENEVHDPKKALCYTKAKNSQRSRFCDVYIMKECLFLLDYRCVTISKWQA